MFGRIIEQIVHHPSQRSSTMSDREFTDKEAGLVNVTGTSSDGESHGAVTPFEWTKEEEDRARRK
jgi:hypothetical protein